MILQDKIDFLNSHHLFRPKQLPYMIWYLKEYEPYIYCFVYVGQTKIKWGVERHLYFFGVSPSSRDECYYQIVTYDEILDIISADIRTELLFHLDVFLGE